MHDPFGVHASQALAERGVTCVRFQFPYQEAKKSGPDRPPVLEATWRAVIDAVRPKAGKLCIGGRSMGGRAASMLAADGFPCKALLLFAYPLHPAGQPEKLRVAHLPDIKVPVLCFNGTRDPLCRRDLMARHVPAPWNMQWLEGADHSLKRAADLEAIATETKRWLAGL